MEEDVLILLGVAFNLNLPLLTAWLLDHWLGDPAWLPHPVVAFGKAISLLYFNAISRHCFRLSFSCAERESVVPNNMPAIIPMAERISFFICLSFLYERIMHTKSG